MASVTPDPPVAPSPPTGLTTQARPGEVVLSWSPPPGGLKSGDGYQIYMGTSPGHEGAKPYVPHLIEGTTSYAIAPLQDGVRYYFQVVLLDGDNQLSAWSAEVSADPSAVTGGGNGTGPSVSSSSPAGIGGGGATAPPTAPAGPDKGDVQHYTSPAPPAVLIVALAGLAVTATGGAIAIVLIQRRRKGRGYAAVPAPRRPYDDQPAGPSRRIEEMNGPRYR